MPAVRRTPRSLLRQLLVLPAAALRRWCAAACWGCRALLRSGQRLHGSKWLPRPPRCWQMMCYAC